MKRRKLTAAEVASIEVAKNALRMVPDDVIDEDVVKVISLLREVERHRTTDGKPYIEPQPEIGEGYRLATKADAWRKDVEYFSNLKGNGWCPRAVHGKPLESSYLYRVPIDRIPTDEDAKQRPTVMVSDASGSMCKWHPATLLAVLKNCYLGTYESGAFSTWAYARFPYPGELD